MHLEIGLLSLENVFLDALAVQMYKTDRHPD